ncbi:MAG: Lacal_2735 family protein [Saprospirales bacterium]|nr:Lacal_2735 family protein [Saprospirales bacterium]
MLNFLKKDPLKKLERQYLNMLEEAMQLQRKGDIKGYALKMAAVESLQQRIEEQKEKGKPA